MSGHTDGILEARGVRREDLLLFQKPFTSTELLDALQRCLQTRRITDYVPVPDGDIGMFGRRIMEFATFDASYAGRAVPEVRETKVIEYIAEGYPVETLSRKETYSHDNNGLLYNKITEVFLQGSTEASIATTEYRSFESYPDYWILTDVGRSSVRHERSGLAQAYTETLYDYDSADAILLSRTDVKDFNRELVTEYDFDSYGNIEREVSWDGNDETVAPRESVTDYGEFGLYPISLRNAEGQLTQVGIDDLTGELGVRVDANDHRVEAAYDAFGNLVILRPGVALVESHRASLPSVC